MISRSNAVYAETNARARLGALEKRASRYAEGQKAQAEVIKGYLEKLKAFKKGDIVTNGQKTGTVKDFDRQKGLLVVAVGRLRIEERWTPEFVSKA